MMGLSFGLRHFYDLKIAGLSFRAVPFCLKEDCLGKVLFRFKKAEVRILDAHGKKDLFV